MAERTSLAGRMRSAYKPATRRSEVRRFGDRALERLRIRSCCLTRTDSATTERIQPGRLGLCHRISIRWGQDGDQIRHLWSFEGEDACAIYSSLQ